MSKVDLSRIENDIRLIKERFANLHDILIEIAEEVHWIKRCMED